MGQPRSVRDSASRSRILISRASSPHNTVASAIPSTPAGDETEEPGPRVTSRGRDQNHHDRDGDVQYCDDLGESVIDSMDAIHAVECISLPGSAVLRCAATLREVRARW